MMIDLNLLIFLGVILLLGLAFVAFITFRGRSKGLNKAHYQAEWEKVMRLSDGDDVSRQMAVITADKLLDKALKESGLAGETMGERLKSAKGRLSDNNQVWQAHKLRNRLVHESDAKISAVFAKQNLSGFKKALKDLGAI